MPASTQTVPLIPISVTRPAMTGPSLGVRPRKLLRFTTFQSSACSIPLSCYLPFPNRNSDAAGTSNLGGIAIVVCSRRPLVRLRSHQAHQCAEAANLAPLTRRRQAFANPHPPWQFPPTGKFPSMGNLAGSVIVGQRHMFDPRWFRATRASCPVRVTTWPRDSHLDRRRTQWPMPASSYARPSL